MNPWIAQLTTLAGGRLLAHLESPEGTFGTSATELMFASSDGVRRMKLTGITRIARSGGAVIISGPDGELLRVKLNVPNDALLAFFQTVKSIANQARLLERDSVRAMPQHSVPSQPPSPPLVASTPPSTASSVTPSMTPSAPPRPPSSPESSHPDPVPSFVASNQVVATPSSALPEPPSDLTASSTFWPAPRSTTLSITFA
jgi:hypothetical protein